MKAVITVIGKDMVGILAKVSTVCAEKGINVIEVTQSILQDMFAMIMIVDISAATVPISELSDEFDTLGEKLGLKTRTFSTPCTESKSITERPGMKL